MTGPYEPATQDAEIVRSLEIARNLVRMGVPMFVAPLNPAHPAGFNLPKGWQQTEPAVAVVDLWRPGMALCAVMGHTFDGLDIDPRHDGHLSIEKLIADGHLPVSYGQALTPSGGTHNLIAPLRLSSRDGFMDGLDLKSGEPDAKGRGFLYIAPTVRPSKADGKPRPYLWAVEPSVPAPGDGSGAAIAARIASLRKRAQSNGIKVGLTGPPADAGEAMRRVYAMRDVLAGCPVHGYPAVDAPPGFGDIAGLNGGGLGNLFGFNAGGMVRENGLDQGDVGDVLCGGLDAWKTWDGKKRENVEDRIRTAVADGVAKSERGGWASPAPDPRIMEIPPEAAAKMMRDMSETQQRRAERKAAVRPDLNVTNQAVTFEATLPLLGTGPLSGMFLRHSDGALVHTPTVGQDGYLAARGSDDRDDDGPAQVRLLDALKLQTRLQLAYDVYKADEMSDGRSPALYPPAVAKMLAAVPEAAPNLRRLRGVVHTPTIRRDGTVLDAPGHDAASGLLFLPDPSVRFPSFPGVLDYPTVEQVGTARDFILELVRDFPFVSESDRAAYIGGLLLTPLLRELVPGAYKLVAVNAHQHGSGKSLLGEIGRMIHGGVFRSNLPEDDAEMRKQITSILDVTTAPLIEFDNVSGTVRSGTLAGMLTSSVWDDRRLGTSDMVKLTNDRLWLVTGNNIQLGGDMVRRTVWVNIDPGMPNPESRKASEFLHPDLKAHTRTYRGDLLHALLVLVRAWIVAGRPTTEAGSDGYAAWVGSVNGILQVAGIHGTFDDPGTRPSQEGVEDVEWGEFLRAIAESFGDAKWTAREVLSRVVQPFVSPIPGVTPIPLEALPGDLADRLSRAAGGTGPATVSKSLGRWFMNRQGRWTGELTEKLTVRRAGEDRNGAIWQIVRSG